MKLSSLIQGAAVVVAAAAAASMAARARARNDTLSSPSPSVMGVPKRTVQASGIGTSVPLGSTRLRFSIHTGTSRTLGQARARWKRSLLVTWRTRK